LRDEFCVIFIDNLNNPTGQFIDLESIEEIVKETYRKDIIGIVDEAYGDYLEADLSAVNISNRYSKLVVTRTFTKRYGIGQFRVG
jgi:histidinol-phosphate aminotransferase